MASISLIHINTLRLYARILNILINGLFQGMSIIRIAMKRCGLDRPNIGSALTRRRGDGQAHPCAFRTAAAPAKGAMTAANRT